MRDPRYSQLRLRIPSTHTFASGNETPGAPTTAPDPTLWQDLPNLFNNMLIECLSTIVVCYSAIYIAHPATDPLAPVVAALAIVAIMMNLKDRTYFCPDANPVATIVLLAAGAYTRGHDGTSLWTMFWGKTLWRDVLARLIGQAGGFVFVLYAVLLPNTAQFAHTPFEQVLRSVNVVVNEGVATAIEAIAIAFVIMPLLRPVPSATSGYTDAFAAKVDTKPPTNKNLFSAALSLGIIHYVLERLFRATMNPFLYVLHCTAHRGDTCSWDAVRDVVSAQLGGMAFAAIYAYKYLPPPGVLALILEEAGRKQ